MRYFGVGERDADLGQWHDEVDHMTQVLVGRIDPPVEMGVMTLMEVASAYHARASEMQMQIQREEVMGGELKGGNRYRFRTGELRTFIEMASKAIDLGSRRVTQAKLEMME